MKVRMALGCGVVMVVGAAGCDRLVDPGGGACRVGAVERALIDEVLQKAFGDALFVTEQSHDAERAYALTLLGVDEGSLGIALLAEPCLEQKEYEPFCDSAGAPPEEPVEGFWATRDRCGQLACEAADVGIARVYLTMLPHSAPDDRHAFSYEFVDGSATVTYDPNPRLDWRVDQSGAAMLIVDADLSQSIVVEFDEGEVVDLSFNGDATFRKNADGAVAGEVSLSFTDVLDGEMVEIDVELLPDGTISGAARVTGRTIATMSGTLDEAPHLEWAADCPSD
jgi:hypothetical protein